MAITKAKKGDQAKYYLLQHLDGKMVDKLVGDIAPRFIGRPGGYTRILKLGKRLKDNADMVLIEWVEGPIKTQNSKLKVQNEDKKKEEKEEKTKAEAAVKTDKKEKKVKKDYKNEKADKTDKKK